LAFPVNGVKNPLFEVDDSFLALPSGRRDPRCQREEQGRHRQREPRLPDQLDVDLRF
jgi:hypothetical protein